STLRYTREIEAALPTLPAYQQFRMRVPQLGEDVLTIFAMFRVKQELLREIPIDGLEQEVRRILNREARLAWKRHFEEDEPALLLEDHELKSKISSLAEADVQMRKLNRDLLT